MKMRVEFDTGVTWEWEGRMDRERMRWIQWNLFDRESNACRHAIVYADGHMVIVVESRHVLDNCREYRDVWMCSIPTENTQLVRIMEVA